MARDDLIRAVYAFGPIVLLAIGVWVYHLRYLRQMERDRMDDRTADASAKQSLPPAASRPSR